MHFAKCLLVDKKYNQVLFQIQITIAVAQKPEIIIEGKIVNFVPVGT